MAKEEMARWLREKCSNHKQEDFQRFNSYYHYYWLGYEESAEPRERRIAELEKENAELKEKISVLLSCKNCSENKCLTQKIEFIKELEEEKCELLGIIQGKDKVIQELEKENAELKNRNKEE